MILFTIEINNICRFSSVCKGCVLGERECFIGKQCVLSQSLLVQASREALGSKQVKDFIYVGKEPLETPDIIFENNDYILSLAKRPRIGIITNGVLLHDLIYRFEKSPVDSVTVSLDDESGLHDSRLNNALLADALKLRAVGGSKTIAVNTVFTGTNLEEVVHLGKKLCKARINQWTVALLAEAAHGMKCSFVTVGQVRDLIIRFAEDFDDVTETVIVVHVPYTVFAELVHGRVAPLGGRVLAKIDGMKSGYLSATVIAQGSYLRLTYFGELFGIADMQSYATLRGSYGTYTPGCLQRVLRSMAKQRRECSAFTS